MGEKKYVALLRGINVGGNRKVEMVKLKSLFESLGYKNVKTYINSGNVVFAGKDPDFRTIEGAIESEFGFVVPTLVVPVSVLEAIVSVVPDAWVNDKTQKVDVLFLWPEYAHSKIIEEMDLVKGVDEVVYESGALVWRVDRTLYSKSYMNRGYIGSILYKNMTARNINTVRKLLELAREK